MRQKSVHPESPSERLVKNIRRATRKRHSSEEKIRIVLDGLRGESSIAAQRKAELKLASWKRASSSSANNAIDAMLYSAGAKAPADFFRTMRTATSRRPKCRRRW